MENNSNINVTSGHARPTCPDFISLPTESWKKSARSQCEWSVRLSNEYNRSVLTIFVTLTFDDEHLPKLHYTPQYSWDVPCFDGERVSEQLIRPLRQIHNYSFKYVFFPEYGSDDEYIDDHGRLRKGTMRPHYHGLFFFDTHIDVEIFKETIYNLWHSCARHCLDVVPIYSDKGFTRYVSKYVSKGIEREHFPHDCLQHVKECRSIVKDCKISPCVHPIDQYRLNHACHFLHWYETHRPKMLCSRGIGFKEYSTSEFLHGTIKMFNGSEFKDTPIPSYNKRNKYYDKGIDTSVRYFRNDSGIVTYLPDGEYYNLQTWSLNDFGRDALKTQLSDRVNNFKDIVALVLNSHGPVSYDNIDRFNSLITDDSLPLEYGITYEDLNSLAYGYINNIGADYFNLMCSYRFLFSRYSIQRFNDITGLIVSEDNIISYMNDWRLLYDFIIDMDSFYYHYKSNRIKGDKFSSLPSLFYVDKLNQHIELIYDMLRYDDYLKAKHERDLQKQHNKIRFRGKH